MYSAIKRKKGFTLASIISCIVLLSVLITIVINVIIAFKSQRESLYHNTLELNRITAGDLSKTTQSLVVSMKHSLQIAANYLSGADLESGAVLAQLDFSWEPTITSTRLLLWMLKASSSPAPLIIWA